MPGRRRLAGGRYPARNRRGPAGPVLLPPRPPGPPRPPERRRRPDAPRRGIPQVRRGLAAATRLDQGPTPVAEWILDNEYIIEANARDVRLNLPRRYSQELPALANG